MMHSQSPQLHGTNGAMLKKKFPHSDMHRNSNIIITMDDKARLKSQYMKKYDLSVGKKVNFTNVLDSRAAGTINFKRGDNQ